MRTRLATASVLAVLALFAAGCGGGSSDGAKDTGSDTPTTQAGDGSSDSGSSGDDSSSGGDVDCAAIKTAAQDLLSVQLLAQIRDPESVETLEAGTIGNLDIDQFLASMKVLHALDGYDNVLGDPKEAIDAYEDAGTQAKALFEADGVTQADIDAYNESIGTTTEFLGHQTAIAGALDEAGC